MLAPRCVATVQRVLGDLSANLTIACAKADSFLASGGARPGFNAYAFRDTGVCEYNTDWRLLPPLMVRD